MPTFHKGQGGSLINSAGPYTLPVSQWELTKDARLAETTNSGSGGSSSFQGTTHHNEWKASVPWDSTNTPEVGVAMDVGTVLTLKLTMGDAGVAYTLTGTTVETIVPVCNAVEDIIRFDITGKGGACTGPA